MSNRLQDQIAIVTGSSSGNGRAIALALSAAGATIVCADLNKKAREEGYEQDLGVDTDDLIRQRGGKACYVQVDVRHAAEVETLVARAVSDFGRLDLMVNNAGVGTGLHTIVEETEAQYDLTMAVNAKGVWLGCKCAITQMLKQEPLKETGSRGKIVNIASVAGLLGAGHHAGYSASKAAVISLTRQLAVNFGPERINVNAVCPGLIQTAMSRPTDPVGNEWFEAVKQVTPWPRLGTPQDVAFCVLFFCSPEAEWVTGAVLTVDGGLSSARSRSG
jgi:NAD(P)-dependent dehydrogenase (short-subunit alcohol dehydrogenase family)